MTAIRALLQRKGADVYTVERQSTVLVAISLMAERNVGALVVLDYNQEVCGIVTERDYLRKVALHHRSSAECRVDEIMTAPVVCVEPEHSVEQAMAIMTVQRFRHLPVVDVSGLIGLVSIGDLVRQSVADLEDEVRHLHRYIGGHYPG
jgi:CBS domain-containing protein